MPGISFGFFKRRKALKEATERAYKGLMQAALAPGFYANGTIDDTFEGRAQMVTLHAAVALRRLQMHDYSPARNNPLADALNAKILDGFDAAYREKGVGDSSIARKVRKLAEAYYGLGKAASEHLAQHDVDGLSEVLVRNGVTKDETAPALANYLIDVLKRFEFQPEDEVKSGQLAWDA